MAEKTTVMAKLNQILMGLALLLCAAPLAAQSCYVQLDDATGVPLPPAQLSELEVAACELRAAFPEEFQSDFAVYDFGFYLHQEGFAGGVPEVFQAKVAEVESESAYFLLFGRQLSRGGVTSEVWVEVRLPEGGIFECLDLISENYREAFSQKLRHQLGDSAYSLADRKLRSIELLHSLVLKLEICCYSGARSHSSCDLCLFSGEETLEFLRRNHFIEMPVIIDSSNLILDADCSSLMLNTGSVNFRGNNTAFVNKVNYPIAISGEQVLLDTFVYNGLDGFLPDGFSVFVIDFQSVLDNSFFGHLEKVKNEGGLLLFVYNYGYENFLFVSPNSLSTNFSADPEYLYEVYEDIAASSSCSDCPDWMLEVWNDGYDANEGALFSTYVLPALPLAAADGPLPLADVILATAAVAVASYDLHKRTYITYIAYNPSVNEHYCGRTSGYSSPEAILNRRINRHHAVDVLFYQVQLDRAIQGTPLGYWCTRGREQQNIDYYGGAISDSNRRPNATCANLIRGVGKGNVFGYFYHWCSSAAWGEKYEYTGYGTQDIEELWDDLKGVDRFRRFLGN